MKSVVKKFLLELNTMTMEKDVEVNATEDAIEFLMTKGFDAKLGARPLQRVIDDEIKKPLSKMMLFGDLTEGGMVEVGLTDDVVPKLTVNFKAKREKQVLDQFKPKKVNNEKTSQ
jgi:ATP-dependent Clp protease ATP-binding subunit ClpA